MTKNFTREEFACNCGCGLDTINVRLVDHLQTLRDRIGRPIIVNSGIRCFRHNRDVGGKATSLHLLGKAADIRVPGMPVAALVGHVAFVPTFKGIGIYKTFVHVDIRHQRASWRG